MWAAFLTDLISKLAVSLVQGLTSWVQQQQQAEKASKAEALERQMASIAEAAKRAAILHEAVTQQQSKPPISIAEWNANVP